MMSSVLVTPSPRRNACSQSLHAQSWVFDLISASVLTHHRHLRCLGSTLLELLHPQSRLDDNDNGSHGEAHPVLPHLGSEGFDLLALSRPRATENRKTWDMNDNTLPCQAGRISDESTEAGGSFILATSRTIEKVASFVSYDSEHRHKSEFGRKNCDVANVIKRPALENWSVKPLGVMRGQKNTTKKDVDTYSTEVAHD